MYTVPSTGTIKGHVAIGEQFTSEGMKGQTVMTSLTSIVGARALTRTASPRAEPPCC